MKNKQKKKIFLLLYVLTVLLYCLSIILSLVLIDIGRKNEARKDANTLMHYYDIIHKKVEFINTIVAEDKWVQNMSVLDEEGFANIFPLDIYEAQRSIINYNALIGFSCETLIMFDRSSYAMTEKGKIPYSELEFYFDGDAQGFTIYSQKEQIFGDVRYVQAGGVLLSIIYNCPNKLNTYKVRCIFVLSKDYMKEYFNEMIDINYISVLYNNKSIFLGNKYKEKSAFTIENNNFVFGYYQEFPVTKSVIVLIIETIIFIGLFSFFNFKIKDYYNNMQRYIRQLNELAGKNYSEDDISEGITKQFENILLEISQIEMQSKVVLSNDFSRLVMEYIRTITHYGGQVNHDVLNGLKRLGVDVNQKIVVAYIGDAMAKTDKSAIYLGDSILFLNEPVHDIENIYGQSDHYEGFAYLVQAYNESKFAYELAVLYEKSKIIYPNIGKLEPMPILAKYFENDLIKDIIALNVENISNMAMSLKKELLKNFINPPDIFNFFDRIDTLLRKVEEEQYIETINSVQNQWSIGEKIAEILMRVDRLIKRLLQKSEDRYVYYFSVIKNYIDQHFTEPDFSLNSIAEKFNYSIAYISRIFSEYGNINYSDYVNEKRIELAKQMLLETNLSINTIGNKCGIISPVTFRRVFKKYTGQLPGVYRENANKQK